LLSRAGREGTARNIINNSFILKTLNSSLRITFITHAIGSVLWLYAMPSTPIFWLALIPIVALERFCLAGATTAILSAIKVVKTHRLLASAKA
jgi:hypothetical protein